MYFSWPSSDYDDRIKVICDKLSSAKNICCIAHPNTDGDALGSQLALYHYCKITGKNCVCLNFEPLPDQLSWLEGADQCRDSLPENQHFDMIFLMETTDARRMGDRVKFFEMADLSVHLDHHVEVQGLGKINLIDEAASSTCEILYNILEKTGVKLNHHCMEAIYVGIMTDTGNFRYKNSTPRAHEIAAELIREGLEVNKIYKKVYENTSFAKTVMHGIAMARAESHCNGKLVASSIMLDDFLRIGATEVDSDGAIRNLSCIKGIEAALLFKEGKGGKVKVSLRSSGEVDVMEIAKKFNGGGHRMASGMQANGTVDEVMKRVIDEVKKALVAKGLDQ